MIDQKYCDEMILLPVLNLRANCISLGIIVTLLTWVAHEFASSNKLTKKAYAAS